MNSKERILVALNSGQPDRVPIYEMLIDEASVIRIAGVLLDLSTGAEDIKTRFGEESQETLDFYCSIIDLLDLDSASTYFSSEMKIAGKNIAIDKFGTKYHLSPHGQPLPYEGPVNCIEDTINFKMAESLSIRDFDGPQYMAGKVGKEKAVFMVVSDPFKLSWKLRGGMEHLLTDYATNPGLVHKLASITTEYNIAAIEYAAGFGIDAIAVEGDLAGSANLLISPAHFKIYIKPYLEKIVEFAHKKGLKIIKHSDGNIWPILDELVEIGFDGIHPIQPQCMDIGEVKKYLGGRACIIGNIDCQELLPNGLPEDVDKAVKETIEIAAPGGGYIISSSNSIHPGVKPENYIAMVKAVHKYGVYNGGRYWS